MKRVVFTYLFVLTSLVALPASVDADEMDVALHRLAQADTSSGTAVPDNAAFFSLMSQLGAALGPPTVTPARTLGSRQFSLSIDTTITGIDEDAGYWIMGTVGDDRSTLENGSRTVDSVLTFTRLHFRKGLPFGLEIGASAGHAFDTSLFIWSAEVRWGLFEGYRRNWQGFLPDIAVRGAVHTVTGDREFNLTIPTGEVIVSKGLVLGSTATLTPFVTAQLSWIAADTGVVFLQAADPGCPGGVCESQASGAVFEQLRALRTRMAVGVQYQYQMFHTALGFRFDLVSPSSADSDIPDDVPRQWNLDLSVGMTY